MNRVILVGRLTADPEVGYLSGENATAYSRFSVAVNRTFKNADGKYDADFIRCVAWRSQAEFVNKYFHKGDMIGIQGNIRTGSYTNKDGQKVYTTEVYVDQIEFVGGRSNGENNGGGSNNGGNYNRKPSDNSFMNVPDTDDEELPWASS